MILRLLLAGFWAVVTMAGAAGSGDAPLTAETYNQWKEALAGGRVTAAGEIRAADGFRVELVRSAGPGEGSWVALAFDPQGRAVVAREDRGLIRFDPGQGEAAALEVLDETLLEVRGLLFAHGALYANANNSRALYRLRDADGDGAFEEVRPLRTTPGGVGHGRNQIALGPDGMIYAMHGDDVKPPETGFADGSPCAHFGEDRWLPLAWDRFNWSHTVVPPAGHVVRTDADGERWELVCGGLRNPFGLAFNAEGEMFTYDADIEWDVGLPWYRPTRVLHLVSGADYGWRGGSRALPAWMPDTAPAAVDIGKGSPTAIAFGTRSHFPEPWRDRLFVMDWAYGVIHAVALEPSGASYRGRASVFLQGRPLNVTGMDFGPDGALYFVTGGRRTQSALYRVAWTGAAASPAAPVRPEKVSDAAAARRLRRHLESFHGRRDDRAVDEVWPHLGSEDPWIRQAARVALEAQPPDRWLPRALEEVEPGRALTALLAAARAGGAAAQPGVRERWQHIDPHALDDSQVLLWARTLQVSLLRHARTPPEAVPAWVVRLESVFPHRSAPVNRLVCELLCAFDAPSVVATSLALLEATPPPTQEDALHVLLSLRGVREGWTLEGRRTWMRWLQRARSQFVGAAALPTTLNHLRAEFEATLSPEERTALAPERAALDQTAAGTQVQPPPDRPFQKAWTVEELAGLPAAAPDLVRGRRFYTEAGCAACHRAGSIMPAVAAGPDLSGVGQRFDRRALLESLVDPWKVIAPQYRMASVTLKSGAIHEGPVVAEDEQSLGLATNPVEPGSMTRVVRGDIVRLMDLSAMPPGLLNAFTREEIVDLVAWLEAGAP